MNTPGEYVTSISKSLFPGESDDESDDESCDETKTSMKKRPEHNENPIIKTLRNMETGLKHLKEGRRRLHGLSRGNSIA